MSVVTDSDVSVVIQGPVVGSIDPLTQQPVTAAALASLRRLLPKAELILSTWQGADLKGLDYDEVIENKDPGSSRSANWFGNFDNTNRMFVSVKAGLGKAKRSHLLRCRTDQVLTRADFLSAFNSPQSPRSPEPWFRKRVVLTNYFTTNPRRAWPGGFFAFSDIAMFGCREDVTKLWDVPSIQTDKKPAELNPFFGVVREKLIPEIYIGILNYLKSQRAGRITPASERETLCEESERFLVDNYLLMPFAEFGFRWPNRGKHLLSYTAIYTPGEIKQLYAKGTSKGFPGPIDSWLPDIVYFFESRMRAWTPGPYKSLKRFYHSIFGHK